jgi:hypothetical protein
VAYADLPINPALIVTWTPPDVGFKWRMDQKQNNADALYLLGRASLIASLVLALIWIVTL